MTQQQTDTDIRAYWAGLTMVGFDTETTGTDVEEDRIVTATNILQHPQALPTERTWVIDPGIPIPDDAAAVHGWTTQRVQEFAGTHQPAPALDMMASRLALYMTNRTPVVACNAPFDFTILERELARHNLPSLVSRISHGRIGPVIDPRVLDKYVDPYRPADCSRANSRRDPCDCGATDKTLTGMTKHYGVELTEAQAHTSAGDALAAIGVTKAIIERNPGRFRGYTIEGLHDAQVVWWRKAQLDFAKWNREKNESKYTGIRPEWPVLPTAQDEGALL